MPQNDLTQARTLIQTCLENQDPYLDLGNCGITNLHNLPELFQCRHLETLILSNTWWDFEGNNRIHSRNEGPHNQPNSIPSEIANLDTLKTMIISGSDGGVWKTSGISFLSHLTALQALDLSYNAIPNIVFLKKLTALQALNLSSNQISDISFLSNLTALQALKISNNQISDISFLSNLTNLRSLNLSSNQISDYNFLSNLTNLRSLNFSANQISDISFLSNLTNLESLNLSSNQISDISFLSNLNSLRSLDLRSNQISDISFLSNLTNLESLNLSSNRISDISFLSNLNSLRSLDLYSNQISDISFLSNLINLQSLSLSSNRISDISFLSNLINLQSLSLSSNRISDISFLSNLINLQSLSLSSNQIPDISFLSNLINLQSLSLSSNRISDIQFLEKLKGLQTLDLRANKISEIPRFIFQLEMEIHLEKYNSNGLCLDGNPIESPPLEILNRGRQSVLNWYKANKIRLNEIKIILIGDPKAGKTSLLRRLKDDDFDENEVQTDGVNIEDIEFGACETFQQQTAIHELTGHFWDFGGQEIMNATHQFFLTRRSIYILVLDARKDDNVAAQIRQWAKRIKATGGNSSIIMVANQIDVNAGFGFENQYDLQQEFSQIKAFIKASCKTRDNIEAIKDKLAELIPQAELFNTTIDERWVRIKEKLQEETQKKYFLDEQQFSEICHEFDLQEKQEQKNAINFLHDLGLVLHFEEINLSEYYVLDPYWITYGVYQILTSTYAGQQKGIVAMEKLEHIVNEEEDKKERYRPANYKKISYTPNQRRFLIDILNQFKLCFCVPDRSRFILPDLLDTNEPQTVTESIRQAEDSIRFVYEYEYLPKSIMPHIMVDTHHILSDMWRTGCVLRRDDCQALVTNYQNRISITVIGEHKKKREFMAVIRHLIDAINQELSDQPNMQIPLPGTNEYADYEELLEREKDGETHYKVYRPIKGKFEIARLLEGLSSPDEMRMMHEKIDEALHKLDDLKCDHEEIMEKQEDIMNKLDSHYQYLINLDGNYQIKQGLLEAIAEINEQQMIEISEVFMQRIAFVFERFGEKLEERLHEIHMDLRETDDVAMKLKLAVPFINILGVTLEIDFDLKSWATRMYKKHEMKLFQLMGYL